LLGLITQAPLKATGIKSGGFLSFCLTKRQIFASLRHSFGQKRQVKAGIPLAP
jgi:hypothetical protein